MAAAGAASDEEAASGGKEALPDHQGLRVGPLSSPRAGPTLACPGQPQDRIAATHWLSAAAGVGALYHMPLSYAGGPNGRTDSVLLAGASVAPDIEHLSIGQPGLLHQAEEVLQRQRAADATEPVT
jgi:hypothetical protein